MFFGLIEIEPYVVWRLANSGFAVIALGLTVWRGHKIWVSSTPRDRLLIQSHGMFLLVAVIVSIEDVIHQTPGGFHTGLMSVAVMWSLYSLLMSTEGMDVHPKRQTRT